MTRLQWTGTEEQTVYHDTERSQKYWPSNTPHTVPPDAVEEYLEHDGWDEVEEGDDPRLAAMQRDRERPPGESEAEGEDVDDEESEQDDGEDVIHTEVGTDTTTRPSPTDVGTAATETDAESDSEFDAEEFVSDTWRTVQRRIENGKADGHLDAVEDAENSRSGSPREASVLEAIDDRRATLADTSVDQSTEESNDDGEDSDDGEAE